ncbi:MAG TPA: hypothetical protein IAC14_13015 [Candidatus Scybalomonas excrementigallinarum]|nr:hypothetical protein [Candidatus Scybalomonas excrementigallinarum]
MTDKRKLEIMNSIIHLYRDCLTEDIISGNNKFDYHLGFFIRKQYGDEIYEDIQKKDKEIFRKITKNKK